MLEHHKEYQRLQNSKRITGPKVSVKVGDYFTTNSGWDGVVLFYNNALDVQVLWQDGSITKTSATYIKNGAVKPPYQPALFGTGYIGRGKFTDWKGHIIKEPIDGVKVHRIWRHMLSRCYSKTTLSIPRNEVYRGCKVAEEWHNFQNFAEWCIGQVNWKNGCLDKDLLGDGKLYSADTCCFLPNEVNVFLAYVRKTNNELPQGIHRIKPRTKGAKVGYAVRCHQDGERNYLGYYDTVEEAAEVYAEYKTKVGMGLADKYKHLLSDVAHDKLCNYKYMDRRTNVRN